MTDLLIEDPGPKEEELDDKQESSLIEVSRRSSASIESVTYQLEVILINRRLFLKIGGQPYQ